jgi:GDP-D-mannose 3',5'-epimerase
MKKVVVLGAGGFIGHHLVKRLKKEGYWVKGLDLKHPDFSVSAADEFVIGDLRDVAFCLKHINATIDEVYQLAADMGGAGYLFSGDNDYNVIHNSALINLNVSKAMIDHKVAKVFFSSSACIYPTFNQQDPLNPNCKEESAYPAQPDSEYGWEKLFSERLYANAYKNYGIQVRIARFHNVYGPEGCFNNGKEKAPAALCRKVALASNNDFIEIWGTGQQTRSFLFIDDCLDGIVQLMNSDIDTPLNIGSEEMIRINDLADLIISISGKKLFIKNVSGPIGVMGRNSDNYNVKRAIGWAPKTDLATGINKTFQWIEDKILNAVTAT